MRGQFKVIRIRYLVIYWVSLTVFLWGCVMKKHVSIHVVLGRLRTLLADPALPEPARRTIGEGVQEIEAAAAALKAALVDAEAANKATQEAIKAAQAAVQAVKEAQAHEDHT